jgi:hypothetical protein
MSRTQWWDFSDAAALKEERGPHLRYLLRGNMLQRLQPGERLTYYVGYLAEDRAKSPEVNQIADAAWTAYQRGMVTLVQQKVSDAAYLYMAIGRNRNYVRAI